MYYLFKKLYFADDEKQNTKTINLEILNGLNKIIEKKYPLFYNEFNDKLKKNIELNHIIGNNTKKYNKAIDQMDEFLDKSERESIVLNESNNNSKYELPSIFDIRTNARVVPKDWWNQLSQLAKDYSNKQK